MRPSPPQRQRPPGVVRIIGGTLKRSRLDVPDRPGLRPTPDRVRETLFNWLGQDLTGWACIDAYAGTGVLGLEAASRGARQVLAIERDAALATALRANARRLKAEALQVQQGDAISLLARQAPASADLVWLDPPYGTGELARALPLAAAVLAAGGHLYLEDERFWREDEAQAHGFAPQRQLKAGAVHAHWWCRKPTA